MGQHCNRHRTDTARYRCNIGSLFLRFFKIDITGELSVVKAVDADIDDDGSLFNLIRFDEIRLSDSDNQNVGFFV